MADQIRSSIIPLSIEKELKASFLDYAMSVIVSRALPDVRDGLKPVHRRILYAMHTLGLYSERPYRKSANVVGEVIAHYHPHGNESIYQAMVGMVQTFSKRYPLLDGQGNWGSIDGDAAAAFRYTEIRMQKLAREMLLDIDKETVPFIPNFEEKTLEPTLLPTRLPQLLLNGSNGIAVGMATSIPPHNITEVLKAALALLADDSISDDEIFALIPAPDLPTGGIICGRAGILKAYKTGHGSMIVRGVVEVEEDQKQARLLITEIPYQVNKSDLITKIADLVKEKVIEGISNIRDESSNRAGIRIVIDLKRGEIPQVIINQLYKHTQLQASMSILLLAIHQGRPQLFTLREMLMQYIAHRRDIVTRRTEFDLRKHNARVHILQGLIVALNNIDRIIVIIRAADTPETAQLSLMEEFSLSDAQSRAVLDMRLQRLTGLERDKIDAEVAELAQTIAHLQRILADSAVLDNEIKEEIEALLKEYGDDRRTRIDGAVDVLSEADLIPDDEVVVTLTRKGYIKRVELDTYSVQKRGGKGKKGLADLGDSDDIVQDLFVTKNHDDLLFFTNHGRVYSLKAFQVPEGSRTARGRAIVNLLPLIEEESVVTVLSARDMAEKFIVMCTRNGVIKKTDTESFMKIRSTGIRALQLEEGDELVFCGLSSGKDTIVVATRQGQGIHFSEDEVRSMGRQAVGVRAIRLKKGDSVVGVVIAQPERTLLFATSQGYGKRVSIADFRLAHRGGMGVRTIPTGGRNGVVIGVVVIEEDAQILLIDKNGKIIRLDSAEIRTMGRQAQGVRLIRLDAGQELLSVTAFNEEKGDEDTEAV